jgi:4-hydroxy-tetrahydrodipicolinate synthase
MNTKRKLINGCATAIITPFRNGEVDFEALKSLIERQILSGVESLVVLGTTGESPTVSYEERDEIIRTSKEAINGRARLIVGTGSNSTKTAQKLTQVAEKLGADGVLCVTPYYNKATPTSLATHYKEIAGATDLPVILYNVPSRTGVSLTTDTLDELTDVPNIVGVKEATGDILDLERKIARYGERFLFYSGSDELVLPSYSVGAVGVISAVANVIPCEMVTLCQLIEQNEWQRARELTHKISPLIKELYREVNPVAVKCALSLLGLCQNELRLPLAPSSRENQIAGELIKLKQE